MIEVSLELESIRTMYMAFLMHQKQWHHLTLFIQIFTMLPGHIKKNVSHESIYQDGINQYIETNVSRIKLS